MSPTEPPPTPRERLPELVGLTEAAAILGVSKQRVAQLARRSDFPYPVIRLRATPVWLADDIRAFEAARRSDPAVLRFPRRAHV